jgi:hypothetical protein
MKNKDIVFTRLFGTPLDFTHRYRVAAAISYCSILTRQFGYNVWFFNN